MAAYGQRGMSELIHLFDTLPAEAEDVLREELPKAARLILSIQKGDVPIRTGDLWRGLSIDTLDSGLKVRAGLLGTTSASGKTNLGPLFYGRVVERGRKAQVVRVERRRRVGGRLRSKNGRKVAGDIVATYTMRVAAEPARPFVDTPDVQAVATSTVEKIADAVQKKMQE